MKIHTQRVKTNQKFLKFSNFLEERISLNSSKRNTLAAEAPSIFCVLLVSNLSRIHMKWSKYISLPTCVPMCVRDFICIY